MYYCFSFCPYQEHPLIYNKRSYPTLNCPQIIIWRCDPIIGLPPSDPRCKMGVKIIKMVNKGSSQYSILHSIFHDARFPSYSLIILRRDLSTHPNTQSPTQYFMKRDSPLICSESCMSFGMIVTPMAWIAHKLHPQKVQP